MTQHTPGPWRVAFGNRLEVHGPKDEIGWPASIVYNAGLCTDKESQANARLIAAAPDLLAALKALHAAHRAFSASEDWGVYDDEARAAAEAAIAKAKGETA